MPKHQVIYGAVHYDDAEGNHRIAWQGDVIDFTEAEADRLMAEGALFDQAAEDQRLADEEARLAEARAIEDQRLADDAERRAGDAEAAAAAASDTPPEGVKAQTIKDRLIAVGVDPGRAQSRADLWALLPAEHRSSVTAG